MASTIGKVRAVFTASTSGLTSGVNAAASSMKRLRTDVAGLNTSMRSLVAIQGAQLFGSVISGAAAAARALQGIASNGIPGLSAAVEEATTLGEEISKSGVIFGKAAGQVAGFAEVASAIGLSRAAALQATGSFGNLFTAMGIGQSEAAQYATTLTALGADLASFNNATVEDAVAALGAALRGEAEPIRRFGVLLDDATLKQVAFSRGLTSSASGNLSPSIKAQAAYFAILQQTSAAQGDFARTSGGLANQQRILSAEFANVSASVGNSLLPVYQQFVTGLRDSLPAFEQAGLQVAALVSRIDFGAVIGAAVGVFSSLVGIVDVLASSLRPIAENILPAIGGAFFALKAESIAAGILSLASTFTAAAKQMQQFGVSALFTSGTFGVLKSAIRAAALATGIGAIGVALGFVAEKLLDYWDATSKGPAVASNLGADAAKQAAAIKAELDKALAAGSVSAGKNAGEAATKAIQGAKDVVDTSLFQSIDQALATAGGIKDALQSSLASINGSEVAVAQTVTVDAKPIKEAVKGIESNSAEGIREMFRIMRGDTGNDVQERQLGVLERIAANTEDMGGFDLEAVDLAPAAGG